MDRQQYVELRKSQSFPESILYEFYVEKCTENCVDYETFVRVTSSPVGTFENMKLFDKNLALERVIEYYDEKFKIDIWTDKEGKKYVV